MYLSMLAAATFLFAFQFLFNQKFEEECGSSSKSAMLFSLYTSVGGFAILFIISGCNLAFSAFSALLAAVYAVIGILYTVAGIKAFGEVNLSAYSVFAMLGGMLLPSLYGIVFLHETLTAAKLLCFILMTVSLVLIIDFKEKSGKRIYYLAVFVLNGMVGVVSAIHQTSTAAVDSFSFLMLARLMTAVMVLPFCRPLKFVFKNTTKKALMYSAGYAAFCGIGNLLVLISLKHLPASVQYPIITGGVMVISLIISLVRRENIEKKNVISTFIAFTATVLIAL